MKEKCLKDPILLTPGPLTTSAQTKSAMLSDFGSWDGAFNAVTASVCRDLLAIVEGHADHVCVPLQGSGTFAVEAALGTLVPRGGKVLVPDNGAYCKRIVRILGYLQREAVVLAHGEQEPADVARIDAALAADPGITHVAQVHCETGTGILNPLPEIAAAVTRHGRRLIIDAMSSYGAIPIDARSLRFDALVAASGKCLEGVPGMGFVIARRTALEASAGNTASLAMDLLDQWQYMQKTGQWRFTPPTHVVAAPGRTGRPPRAVSGELRGAGVGHARARLRDLSARRAAGAHHRDLSRTARPELRVQGVLRPGPRSRVRPLSREIDRRRDFPRRMHRCDRCRCHAPGRGRHRGSSK
jgi:2-aminoethylphosphonate--pyruvate transaminase